MAETNEKKEISLNDIFGLSESQIDAIAAIGSNMYEQGRVRDAEVIFEGLIAIDAKNYYGYAGLGAMALAEEKLDEALQHLNKAVELNPKDPTVRANLGETLLRKAQFNEAAKEFEKALELDPDERDPGANRARAIIEGMQVVISEVERLTKTAGAEAAGA